MRADTSPTSPREGKSASGRSVSIPAAPGNRTRPESPPPDTKRGPDWTQHQVKRQSPDPSTTTTGLLDTKLGPERAQATRLAPPPPIDLAALVQEGQRLLGTPPTQPAALGAAPSAAELECAAFLLSCYRAALQAPAADASHAELAAMAHPLRAAMVLATPCPPDEIGTATKTYFAQIADAPCDEAACVWALRAGGTAISPEARRAAFDNCLKTLPSFGRADTIEQRERQREDLFRGLAAAVIASQDPHECANFRWLLGATENFESGTRKSDQLFALDALSGWTPALKGLDLPHRSAAMVELLLEALIPSNCAWIGGFWEPRVPPWGAASCVAALATVLHDAPDPQLSAVLVQHLLECIEAGANLNCAVYAVLALRVVLGPTAVEPLIPALQVRAAKDGALQVWADATTGTLLVSRSFAQNLIGWEELGQFDDDRATEIAGRVIPHRWGHSQLSVEDRPLQALLPEIGHGIRDIYKRAVRKRVLELEAASRSTSPGPQIDSSVLAIKALRQAATDPGFDTLQAELLKLFRVGLFGGYLRGQVKDDDLYRLIKICGANVPDIVAELGPVLDRNAEQINPDRLMVLTTALAGQAHGVCDPAGWYPQWLAIALPLEPAHTRPGAEGAWAQRILELGPVFGRTTQRVSPIVLRAFIKNPTIDWPPFQRLFLQHICQATVDPRARHLVLQFLLNPEPKLRRSDDLQNYIQAATTFEPVQMGHFLDDLAHIGVPPGTPLPRERARDIVWTAPMAAPIRMLMAYALAAYWGVAPARRFMPLDTGPQLIHGPADEASLAAREDASFGARAQSDPRLLFERGPAFAIELLRQIVQLPELLAASTAPLVTVSLHAAAGLEPYDPQRYQIAAILGRGKLLNLDQMNDLWRDAQQALRDLPTEGAAHQAISQHIVAMYSGWLDARERAIHAAAPARRPELIAELVRQSIHLADTLGLPEDIQGPLHQKLRVMLTQWFPPQAAASAVQSDSSTPMPEPSKQPDR